MERDKARPNTSRRVCRRGQTPIRPVPMDDVHFTCLCMTTMNGDPVQFVCIVAQKQPLNFNVMYGLDVNAPWIGKPLDPSRDPTTFTINELKDNIGPGKRHPGGVTIEFQGKKMKMRVFHNETGTMTSSILVDILKGIDEIELFERRDDVPPPAILVDGHGSRFGHDFLCYINNQDLRGTPLVDEQHYWNAYIGLPNCTGIWQVGDSSEQNGNFKKGLREAANVIRDRQAKNSERLKIVKSDIVPMIMKAYPTSFGNKSNNRKALAKRGWNPMNRNTLLEDSIVNEKKGTHRYGSDDELDLELEEKEIQTAARGAIACSIEDAESLRRAESKSEWQCRKRPHLVDEYSVSGGKVYDVLESCRKAKRRNIAGEKKLLEMRKRSAEKRVEAKKQADISARVSAGNEALKGNLCLNNKELGNIVRIKEEEKSWLNTHKSLKWYTKIKKVYDWGVDVMENKPDVKDWTSPDYGKMLYFKQLYLDPNPVNGGRKKLEVPGKLKLRKDMWNIVKHYADPVRPTKPEGYDEYNTEFIRRKEVKAAEVERLRSFGVMDT